MLVQDTKHFSERVGERYEKPDVFAHETFIWLMKKYLKKDNMRGRLYSHDGKQREFRGEIVQTRWLLYRDRKETLKFCYCGTHPRFTLITFFKIDNEIFDK